MAKGPDFRAKLEKIYIEPQGVSVAGFKKLIDVESDRMGTLIRKVGVQVE